MFGVKRNGARFDLCMPRCGRGWPPFAPGPALLVVNGPRSLFSLDELFSHDPTLSSQEVAPRPESRDVASLGATLAPAVAHATDQAVQHQRVASVGDDPRLRASRIRAHDDHSAAEAPEAVPLLLSSLYVESFPCGDS